MANGIKREAPRYNWVGVEYGEATHERPKVMSFNSQESAERWAREKPIAMPRCRSIAALDGTITLMFSNEDLLRYVLKKENDDLLTYLKQNNL